MIIISLTSRHLNKKFNSDFKEMTLKDKIMSVLIAPIQLWMNLTVPILDEDDINKTWNKATTLLQVCYLHRIAIYCPLQKKTSHMKKLIINATSNFIIFFKILNLN